MRGSQNTIISDKEERKAYVMMLYNTEVNNISVPFSYGKHWNFLNFEEFKIINPIYVNLVRNPLDRIISWFYYIRQNHVILEHNPETNETNSTV